MAISQIDNKPVTLSKGRHTENTHLFKTDVTPEFLVKKGLVTIYTNGILEIDRGFSFLCLSPRFTLRACMVCEALLEINSLWRVFSESMILAYTMDLLVADFKSAIIPDFIRESMARILSKRILGLSRE